MVSASIASGNIQPTDSKKRREQTIERARANHLCRQLQLRLQYARLKVDHGWQKQNLNEVENLYFHHSHQRGPQPYPPPSIVVTTQRDTTSLSQAHSSRIRQSSLSFRFGPSRHQTVPPRSAQSSSSNNGTGKTPPISQTSIRTPASASPTPQSMAMTSNLTSTLQTGTSSPALSPAPLASTSGVVFQPSASAATKSNALQVEEPSSKTAAKMQPLQHTDTFRITQSSAPGRLAASTPSTVAAGPWPTTSTYLTSLPTRQNSAATVVSDTSLSGDSLLSPSPLTYDSFWLAHQISARKFSEPGLTQVSVRESPVPAIGSSSSFPSAP